MKNTVIAVSGVMTVTTVPKPADASLGSAAPVRQPIAFYFAMDDPPNSI